MLPANPLDVLLICQVFADLLTPLIDLANVVLNSLGFFIPSGRDICLTVFNALDSVL